MWVSFSIFYLKRQSCCNTEFIDRELHDKLHDLLRYDGCSANGKVLYLIRQANVGAHFICARAGIAEIAAAAGGGCPDEQSLQILGAWHPIINRKGIVCKKNPQQDRLEHDLAGD